MAVTLNEIDEFLRQSTPRNIPANIRECLLPICAFQSYIILGGVLLGFVLLFFVIFFSWNVATEMILDTAQSSQSEALVTTVEDTSMRVNKRQVKRVKYEFTTRQEQKSQGYSYFTRDIPAVDSRRTVSYLTSNPKLNRLEGGRLNPTGYWGFLIAILPTAGLVFVLATLGYRRNKMRVLRLGQFELAQVQSIEATNVIVNKQRRFIISMDIPSQRDLGPFVHYGYGREVDLAQQRKDSSEPLGVLFDPAKPSRMIIIDSLFSQ